MKKFPEEKISNRIMRLLPFFKIIKPDGDGPFPVVIMLHGCGREVAPYQYYADAAKQNNIACIIVDSFSPRLINRIEAASTICTGIKLHGKERAGDLICALNWAQNQDWVDKNNIFALGWSHGGWTIMDGLALEIKIGKYAHLSDCDAKPLEGLKAAFMIYPWCGIGSNSLKYGWQRKIPSHIIICGKDRVAGERMAKQTVKHLKNSDVQIETTYFANGTHSFDEEGTFHPAQKFDPELTEIASEIFVNFIKENIAIKPMPQINL